MIQHSNSALVFTNHALMRMCERGIRRHTAEVAFHYGTQSRQENDAATTFTMDYAACERMRGDSTAPNAYACFGVRIVVINENVVKTVYVKEEVAA